MASVCVITGATGHPNLAKCIRSVQAQTAADVEHLVVIDGSERAAAVNVALAALSSRERLKTIELPHATGKNGWGGHRINGAMPAIAMSEYVCWLDEDNWIDPDHVTTLMASAAETQAGWSFALRNLVNSAGEFIARDDCESLGNLHATWIDPSTHHVDTNCYLLHRDLAIRTSSIWNRPGRHTGQPRMGPDRMLCNVLLKLAPTVKSTRRHTVHYAVGSQPGSVPLKFFLDGNADMRKRFPDGLPWER